MEPKTRLSHVDMIPFFLTWRSLEDLGLDAAVPPTSGAAGWPWDTAHLAPGHLACRMEAVLVATRALLKLMT